MTAGGCEGAASVVPFRSNKPYREKAILTVIGLSQKRVLGKQYVPARPYDSSAQDSFRSPAAFGLLLHYFHYTKAFPA
jgi:hypothetical protein